MSSAPLWVWLLFVSAVMGLILVDLLVHRGRHGAMPLRTALWHSAFYIGLALAFGIGVFALKGSESGVEYMTAYLLEKSLSLDNIFVFALIFTAFGVPEEARFRVLFLGILGALVLRAIMITAGVSAMAAFEWMGYAFGAVLAIGAWRMMTDPVVQADPARGRIARAASAVLPVADGFAGNRFFVRQNGRWLATPLLIVLIVVEFTDLVFAMDSVPAALAVSDDAFIVYSSNVLAILGLRALYFVLEAALVRFHYLRHGLAAILILVAAKLIVGTHLEIPAWVSLLAVCSILTAALVLSMIPRPRGATSPETEKPAPSGRLAPR